MNDKDDSDVDPISERIIGNIFDYIYNAFLQWPFFRRPVSSDFEAPR